jgi:nitrite reductase/ring-hydroxylating ferredoxin subunit
MPFTRVASLSDLRDGWVLEARAGGSSYAILQIDGEIRAFDGSCPCTGGPLGCGAVREGLLVCPWHGWRFDVATGVMAYNAAIQIARFPVKIESGEIFIDVTEPRT